MADDPLLTGGAGGVQYQRLLDDGHSQGDVDEWRRSGIEKMMKDGHTPDDIKKFWNLGDPDWTKLESLVKSNIAQVPPEEALRFADNPWDSFRAGLQHSMTGLSMGAPNLQVDPQHAGLFGNLLASFGQAVGDIPGMVAGAIGGAAAGAAVAPEAAPVAAALGGGAGAAALPEAFREVLMAHYEHPNGPWTWKEVWTKAAEISMNTGKAALTGAASAFVGGKVGEAALAEGASKMAAGFRNTASMATSATLIGGALDGRVPNAEDFVSGSILALSFHGAGEFKGATQRWVGSDAGRQVTENLRDTYVATGRDPNVVGELASRDAVLRGEVYGPKAPDGTRVTPELDNMTLRDPEPFTKPVEPEEPAKASMTEDEKAVQEGIDKATRIPFQSLIENGDMATSPYLMPNGEIISTGGDHASVATDAEAEARGMVRFHYGQDVTGQNYLSADINKNLSEKAKQVLSSIAIRGNATVYIRDMSDGQEYTLKGRELKRWLDANRSERKEQGWEETQSRALITQGDDESWNFPVKREPPEPPAGGGGKPPAPPGGGAGGGGEPPKRIGGPGEPPMVKNLAMAQDEIADFIGKKTDKSWFGWLNPRTWLSQFEAQLSPARRLDRELGLDQGQLGVEDMFRRIYGSMSIASTFLRYGVVRMGAGRNEYVSDASFAKAYAQLKADGGDVRGFTIWRLAQRTLEKAGQGIETGIDPETAKIVVDDPEAEAKYRKAHDIMQESKNGVVDYAVDGQVLSPEAAKAMRELNQYHVFFQRIMDPNWTGPSKGFNPRSPTKKMEGGEGQINDPVTADFSNVQTMVAMADRNIARLNLLGRFREMNAAIERENVGRIVEFNKVEVKDLDRDTMLKAELQDENGQPIPDNVKEAALPLITERAFNGGAKANQFLVWENGRPQVYEVKGKYADDVMALMHMSIGPKEMNIVLEAMQKIAGIDRIGITLNPSFTFRALFHQQFQGAITGEGTPVPFANMFKGLFHVLKADETYQRFLANGGGGLSVEHLDDNFIKRNIGQVFTETSTLENVKNWAQHPIDAYRALAHMLHEASAVGAMERFENRGFSTMKAAMKSRTEYLDFAEPQAANWLQQFARTVPFMNVGMRDVETFIKSLQDKPMSTLAKGISMITLPTILNFMANMQADKNLPEDQKYTNLPEWQRMMFFNLPPINGIRIRIPRPYVLGYAFGAIPEMFLREFSAKDPHGFDHWSKNLWDQMVPPFIPTVARPISEEVANKNFLTGRPLTPAYLEKADGYMRYTPNTSGTAIRLAQVLGKPGMNVSDVSPIVLDNYVKQLTGPLGFQVFSILGNKWKPAGAPSTWADIPFVGSFIARDPGTSGQIFEDLHEKLNEYDAAHADFKLAQQPDRIRTSELSVAMQDKRAFFDVTGIRHALNTQMAMIRNISTNPDMTDAEKLKNVDAMMGPLVTQAKAWLKLLDMVEHQ